jgi:flavin reductase (DIM6/NTAB) family NADH-FMN oxidoreductase RutF
VTLNADVIDDRLADALTQTVISPSILYFGTPVALISTVSAAGTPNLMPMSSVFFLGQTGILGIGGRSQTARNLRVNGECVINLPSADLVSHVNALALTTGRDPVPGHKAEVGYEYVADKFARARLTPVDSDLVTPPRVLECPVALEATVVNLHDLDRSDPDEPGGTIACEVAVRRVHVHDSIRVAGHPNRIDPDRWRPLIMSFQRFYGLTDEIQPSRLATIDEEWYR